MARFSVCGGDDGEGSRKRQRLPSIDEEEDTEDSNSSSSGEEEEEQTQNPCIFRESRIESDDSDCEIVSLEKRIGKSVGKNQSSTSKDSLVTVTLMDPDVLDCPICCEALKTPIFQCDNGHLSCSLCCKKVRNICPSCTLPIGYLRCRAMEKVVETSRVSCPNSKYGCKENTSYANRSIHENLCRFTPCHCPCCNFIGYYKDLNNHVRVNHKADLIPFIKNFALNLSLNPTKKLTILQGEYDGEVIVLQAFRTSQGAHVTVSYIAPSGPGVEKLSCSLVYSTDDGVLKQGLMVKNVQEVRYEQPEDGFMLVPSYLLGGNGSLELKVLIGRGRAYLRN